MNDWLQIILTVLLVVLILPPFMTMTLRRTSRRMEKTGKAIAYPGIDSTVEALLKRLQVNYNIIESDSEKKILTFDFQGGHFVLISNLDKKHSLYNTCAISFFSCFEAVMTNVGPLQAIVNRINNVDSPYKVVITSDPEDGHLTVNLHTSGIKLQNTEEDCAYLQNLLSGFFELRRLIADTYNDEVTKNPSDVFLDALPSKRACYVLAHSMIEDQPEPWNKPWYEFPNITLNYMLSTVGLPMPSANAKILINGEVTILNPSEFKPLSLLVEENLSEDIPVKGEFATIDIVESDNIFHRSVHILMQPKEVDDRIILVNVSISAAGMPISSFRPADSPDTQPLNVEFTIGIHRQGYELYKAEAEYMAEEQGLVSKLNSGEAAYNIYWGKALFTEGRYFEAEHYLHNAFELMSPQCTDLQAIDSEEVDMFFELCFFLGVTYYQLGRYGDSYFYLDIIVQQHRVKWTEQYLLTAIALNDPRVDLMIGNLRTFAKASEDENSENEDSNGVIGELKYFLDRQEILLLMRRHETEQAREKLEKLLADNADDQFALHWLAKIG